MALLRNNNVYVVSIRYFQDWYQTYLRYLEDKYHVLHHPVSFQEDFQILIRVINGVLVKQDLYDYLDTTRYDTEDETLRDIRDILFDDFIDFVYRTAMKFIPNLPSIPVEDVFYCQRQDYFYILDRRRLTYAPDEFFNPNFTRSREPLLDDDAWG